MHLVEIPIVHDRLDHLDDVVGLVRGVGNDRCEFVIHPVRSVDRCEEWGDLHVVRRQERQQVSDLFHSVPVVLDDEMGYSRFRRMGVCAAELVHRYLFTGDGTDDIRPCDEEMGGTFDLEYEVGQGGGVDGPASTRSHDDRYLRDDP